MNVQSLLKILCQVETFYSSFVFSHPPPLNSVWNVVWLGAIIVFSQLAGGKWITPMITINHVGDDESLSNFHTFCMKHIPQNLPYKHIDLSETFILYLKYLTLSTLLSYFELSRLSLFPQPVSNLKQFQVEDEIRFVLEHWERQHQRRATDGLFTG